MRELVQLVLNAILYSTSASVRSEPRSAAKKRRKKKAGPRTDRGYSSESVYHLPGFIDITDLRKLQRAERGPSGAQLMHRFMVRGHWRRPNPSWKDQRTRWIKPYWKGPDMAATIERAYRLKTAPEQPEDAPG